MAREIDPSDRIQLRSRGELNHPGSCAVCGSGDEERTYVDLGVFYDYEGDIYLCNLCGVQVGEALGLFTPDEVALTQRQLTEHMILVQALQTELDNARPIVNAIRNLPLLVGSDTAASVLTSAVVEAASETPPDVIDGAVEGEPEVTEHSGESGRSDVNGNESGNGSKPKRTKPTFS